MTKYIHLFETEAEFTSAYTNNYVEPWVSYTEETSALTYNKTEDEKLLGTPLTFEVLSNGNITWNFYSGDETTETGFTIEYKKNGGEWTEIAASTGGTEIQVNNGDIVQFRGDNPAYDNWDEAAGIETYAFFNSTCQFKAKANIMSLIDSTDFATATTLQSGGTFGSLFGDCTGLTNAGDLLLPATTLTEWCYSNMFYGCTSLTTAPELPATVLPNGCYQSMFYGCTSLTTAPILPATTLAEYCYMEMFEGCTSLTTAPELPATTLRSGCYRSMFDGCTNLVTAPVLPATTLAGECYHSMFNGCTSLTTAPELPATTLADSCYSNMFFSCTNLTTAPELPATTLAERCYVSMFRECTSLTTAPSILPATALTTYCYSSMFQACTSLTTAPELPATTLADGCYQNMFYDCISLNYIKCLATDISAYTCTANWVGGSSSSGVASSGRFVKNPSMTSWTTGVNGIPRNWTVEDA